MNKENAVRNTAFTKFSVPKTLAVFIIPSALSQLTVLIQNLADAFFVGRTGDTYQISAMTVTFPVVMLITCIATVFGAGANTNIAAELAKGNSKRAKHFSVFSIYTAAAIMLLISTAVGIIKVPMLTVIGANESSLDYCKDYLFWTIHAGCLPMLLSQIMAQLFLAEGRSKISAFGISGAAILNVILDPIFIFGFKMQIEGAALATCLSNCCSLVYYLIMYCRYRKDTVICFHPKYYQARNGICIKVLTVGIPAGLVLLLMDICDFTRNYYFNILGGQNELAAWGVVQKIGNAFMQICVGIAQGIRPVTAYHYSAELFKRLKAIINGGIVIVAAWVGLCYLLVYSMTDSVVKVLLPTGDAIPIAVSYIRVWILCLVGFGYVELFNSVFQAMGKWRTALVNTVINKGFMMTPLMILLANMFGISGIIISQPITENLTAAALFVVYMITMKKLKTGGISHEKVERI